MLFGGYAAGYGNRAAGTPINLMNPMFEGRPLGEKALKALASRIQKNLEAQYPGTTMTFANPDYNRTRYPKGSFTLTPPHPNTQKPGQPAPPRTFEDQDLVLTQLKRFGAKQEADESWTLKGIPIRFSTWTQFNRGV